MLNTPILGVFLSETLDLNALYGEALRGLAGDVVVMDPSDITSPEDVRFALCWAPDQGAFAPFRNLEMAMSIGAGVDALLGHKGLRPDTKIARVRDPHQADLMAGFAAHAVLDHGRSFDQIRSAQASVRWVRVSMQPPAERVVAVLGHGTMGRAVAKSIAALGFVTRVACRSEPADPLAEVDYIIGLDAPFRAAQGADYLINVLPLTPATENVLNADLFAQLKPGAYLVQIGRGEHLVEADMVAALESGQLSGATLDVFRQEPLHADHSFWRDPRLRITPHIASDSMPKIVAAQVIKTARALRNGDASDLIIDRSRGY